MTPREAMIRALRRKSTVGLVPHLELEYQLTSQEFGEAALHGGTLEGLTGSARDDALRRNAELWIRVAERFQWNVITGTHWLPLDDQCRTFELLRELSGDTYMLSAFLDPTHSIPSGTSMMDHVLDLADNAEQAKEQSHRNVEGQLAVARTLRDAGAEIVFMCADYCFNEGPFLSPTMFAEFVTPFLTDFVTGLRELGMWTVKHTDGDIMPILDQLVSSGTDALHSLDPMAGVDVRRLAAEAGDRVCLIGNVDCSYLQEGRQELIRDSALYALEYGGVDRGGFVLASSNCIFAGVPQASYDTMLAVREEYGRAGVRRPVERLGPPKRMGER
jgi:uroporphyrinogen decarboxylase